MRSSQHSKFNETLLGLISICLYIYVPRKANNYPALRKIYSSNFERVLLRVDDSPISLQNESKLLLAAMHDGGWIICDNIFEHIGKG